MGSDRETDMAEEVGCWPTMVAKRTEYGESMCEVSEWEEAEAWA